MGINQRAEGGGLYAAVVSAALAAIAVSVYLRFAPAIWLVSLRQYMVAAGVIACCAIVSFIVGYSWQSHSWSMRRRWYDPVRRLFEVVALGAVYGSTVFLATYAFFGAAASMFGTEMFADYIRGFTVALAAIMGYFAFVQAEMMSAKTLAALLPLFVVAGVTTAGLTTDDPVWWRNNFSQLGDRTTFAANTFNATLIMAGVCVIIIGYFAVAELVASYRQSLIWSKGEIPHFTARMAVLMTLLAWAGVSFAGVGVFRYTPHPILHNVFARGLTVPMSALMIALPWLAPRMPRVFYVVSDLIIVAVGVAGVAWLRGLTTLTNVEALACLLFMAWFIVFSRQIAAIEADRVHEQLMRGAGDGTKAIESRLSPSK